MSRTLVVSDNEFLNILYVMNLEVYLGTSVTLVESSKAALTELKGKEKFDLIITLETVEGEPAAKLIQEHLKAYGQKIPMIIPGSSKEELISDNVYGVVGKFPMQNILKMSAKILGITAKKMAELDVGECYPISLISLKSIAIALCNIYEQRENHFKILIRQDEKMEDVLYRMQVKNIGKVYVNSSDRLTMINKISLSLIEKITETLKNLDAAPIEKKVQVLSDGYEFAAANLFSNDEIKEQMQQIAAVSAKVMQDVAKEVPNLKALLAVMMNNKDGYVFSHSMIISYVTYHMIKNMTWGGEGQIEKINFVLFFHDIFLGPIYLKHPELRAEASLLESDKLTEAEKDTVLNHAKLAAEIVVSYKRCPMGADILIKQHHGMKKGVGFAKHYMEDLSPISKILLVAEMFVEEFMKASENKTARYTPKIAIPKLSTEFKTQSYLKIVESLINVPI